MGESGARNGGPATLTPLSVFCKDTPIIPAIRKPEFVEQAIASRGKLVYLLTGDPDNVESMIRKIVDAGKIPLVNLDLLNGFSRDKYAVNYLKRLGAKGIISTHLDPLRHALAIGLYGIQRTFLLDSGAMDTISEPAEEHAGARAGDSAGAGGAEDAGAGAGDLAGPAGGGRRADRDDEGSGRTAGAGTERGVDEQPGDVAEVEALLRVGVGEDDVADDGVHLDDGGDELAEGAAR